VGACWSFWGWVDCWVVEFRELGEGLNRGRNVEGEVRFSFFRVGFFPSLACLMRRRRRLLP
jgi:hypothetical protein